MTCFGPQGGGHSVHSRHYWSWGCNIFSLERGSQLECALESPAFKNVDHLLLKMLKLPR